MVADSSFSSSFPFLYWSSTERLEGLELRLVDDQCEGLLKFKSCVPCLWEGGPCEIDSKAKVLWSTFNLYLSLIFSYSRIQD